MKAKFCDKKALKQMAKAFFLSLFQLEFYEDKEEKVLALNSLMEKYQKEGNYEKLNSKMHTVQEVTVIKLIPYSMKGKYKIGQQWTSSYRLKIAKNILKREKEHAKLIFDVMGIEILENGTLKIKNEPIL